MEDSIPVDIVDSVYSFTLGAWIMIFFTAYALWAISCIHQRREECASYITESLWSLYGYIFGNPSMKEYNWVSRLIALLFSMFSLLIVICYLKNTITTDRIKMKEQYVYRSYRDIDHALNEGSTLHIIYSPQSEFVSSLTADPFNSVRQSLYRHVAVNKRGRGLIGGELVGTVASDDYNTVMIDGKLATQLTKYMACKRMRVRKGKFTPDTCLHRTEESVDEGQAINGILISSSFSLCQIHSQFKGRSMAAFESGLISRAYSLIYEEMIPASSRMDCMSESKHVIQHEPHFQSIHIDLFYNFFILLSLILLSASFALLLEILENRKEGEIQIKITNVQRINNADKS